MQSSQRVLVLFSLLCFLFSAPAGAYENSIETENFRLVYNETTQGHMAKYAVQCFENAYRFHQKLFNYTSKEKITVGLYDFADFGNAGATATPKNHIIFISIAPLNFVYETSPANERINTTMNHEILHIVALDQAAGSDNFFRGLFRGKVEPGAVHPESIIYSYLTTPRHASPRWYHEGMAVFLETWMAGGIGRAQGAYDEMVFRSKVRDGSYFYDPVGLESQGAKIDWQVGTNNYLYGTRFVSYLAYEYSPESLVKWLSRAPGSKKYFATQFRNVFGRSLDDVWKDWIAWEHEFQRANLDSIRQYPTTPTNDITSRGLGSVSRLYHDPDTNEIYAGVRYPGTVGYIAGINMSTGTIRKICNIKNPALHYVTSIAYDPVDKKIFYTADNDEWRDMYSVDVRTGKQELLIKDGRVGDLSYSRPDRSIWGIRHAGGFSTLVRIPYPHDKWNMIYQWPFGLDVYDIDISPDGKQMCASVVEISGRQTLRLWDTDALLNGQDEPRELYDFGTAIPANFVFTKDNSALYGSSYFTGVSNIWRYDLGADTMATVSNTEDGFFRPVHLGGDSLIVCRYTGDGFVPTLIDAKPLEDVSATRFLGTLTVKKHPSLERWLAGRPSEVEIDSLITYTGVYKALGNVQMTSVYPIVEGYKDFPSYGLNFNFSDPLSNFKFDFSASVSPNSQIPDSQKLHLNLGYKSFSWNARARLNRASFYDLFGPTKSSRKGYSLGIGHTKHLLYDAPREMNLYIDVLGYGGLERLVDAQNIATSSDKVISTTITLDYSNITGSLGAVEYERGHSWDVSVDGTYTNGDFFPNFVANLSFGLPMPLHHSSLWFRNSMGYSPGRRTEPSANFYFGGFGNNWIDSGSSKRYREYYAFPGIDLEGQADVFGTNFARSVMDWNLPPLRFRRLGIPSFYMTSARASIFATALVTNFDEYFEDLADRGQRNKIANLGSQVDFRFSLMSYLKLTFSVGYARAFEEDQRYKDEYMVSLKIL